GHVESGPNAAYSSDVDCCCQSAAYTVLGLLGSIRTSLALVYSSLYSTLANVRPPSVERYTPRSAFGPYGWPRAATKRRSGLAGSTSTYAIICVSSRPKCVQVRPVSLDRYMPLPVARSGRMMPAPVPT